MKRNLQVFKFTNTKAYPKSGEPMYMETIYIFDMSSTGLKIPGDGYIKPFGIYLSGTKWEIAIGPPAVYDDNKKQYKVINKRNWHKGTWLEALLISGQSKRKIEQAFARRFK